MIADGHFTDFAKQYSRKCTEERLLTNRGFVVRASIRISSLNKFTEHLY